MRNLRQLNDAIVMQERKVQGVLSSRQDLEGKQRKAMAAKNMQVQRSRQQLQALIAKRNKAVNVATREDKPMGIA